MRKRKHYFNRIYYLIGFFSIIISGIFWWQNNIQPVNNTSDIYQTFTIDQGTSLRQIANNLKTHGLIRNPYAFIIVTKLKQIENKVQAGTFKLSANMNAFTIADNLVKSTSDIPITFPEGKRAEEIAEILSDNITSLIGEEIATQLSAHEGYLFPDTYNFEKDTAIEKIIQIFLDNFENKFTSVINNTKLQKSDIVIIASLIEREARHEADRKLVASVIHNRLSIGMKLDIDATVQYSLGYDYTEKTWWKKGLTNLDLQIESPYNTYRNAGLPPTPIANPGLAALQAAANPADTQYLYYFTDRLGINHYARTLEEQNSNIRRYGL